MKRQLPRWFLDRFALGRTPEEYRSYIEWWRTLSPEKQDDVERVQRWSMEEWLDCMEASERSWRWWDMQLHSDNELLLAVVSPEWPFTWGALRWLLLACDVEDVTPEWEGNWATALGLL